MPHENVPGNDGPGESVPGTDGPGDEAPPADENPVLGSSWPGGGPEPTGAGTETVRGVRRLPVPSWLDAVLVLAGLAALGVSFLPWYGATGRVLGHGPSVALSSQNAWQLGVLGWLGVVLAVWAAGTVLLQRVFGSADPAFEVSPAVLALALATAGLVLIVVRLLTLAHGDLSGHGLIEDKGAALGSYLGLAVLAVQAALAGARLFLLTRLARAG